MANFSVSSGINEPYSSNGLGASASGSVWQGAQSVQGNYTDVGWSISATLSEKDGYTWGGGTRGDIGTCRMIINGSVVGSFGMSLNTGAGPGTGLGSSSGSTRIYHNSDGTKSISAYIDFVQGGSDMHVSSTSSGAQTITLTTIPRASVPTVSKATADAGSQITVYTNKKASFTHTITYAIGSASGTIGTGVVDSVNWTIPKDLLKQFTTSATGSCTISCTTYNGSTKIGDTKTCKLNISVPTDAYPSASISSIVENNTYIKNKNASITVQTISDKTVNVTAGGQYGATIKSITVANGASTGKLTASGSVRMTGLSSGTYTMSVTDSRGITKTVTSTQTYYSYRAPQITQATCARTTQTGSNGTLTVAGAYSNILSNVVSISIKRSDQSAVSITPTYSGTNWSSSKAYTDLAYTNAYSWTITVGDSFGQSATTTFTLSASQPIWFLGKTLARLAGKLFCKNIDNSETVKTNTLTTTTLNATNINKNGTDINTLINNSIKSYLDSKVTTTRLKFISIKDTNNHSDTLSESINNFRFILVSANTWGGNPYSSTGCIFASTDIINNGIKDNASKAFVFVGNQGQSYSVEISFLSDTSITYKSGDVYDRSFSIYGIWRK